MATSSTSDVTERALEEHRDVVLNVREDNVPAIAVYERLGYFTHAPYIEGPAVRRAAWGRLIGALKERKKGPSPLGRPRTPVPTSVSRGRGDAPLPPPPPRWPL